MLAREIERDPKVLIAAQPTRGLDVGAIEFVHRRLIEERDEGRAILLVSLELEEVLSLSDRILVMYEGEIVGEFPPTATEEELGFAMTGGEAERSRSVSDRASGGIPPVQPFGQPSTAPGRAAGELRRSGSRSRSGPAAFVAPLLTVLIAFVMGGLVVLVTTGKNPLETYKAIFEGSGLNWLFPWVTGEERVLAGFNLQQTLIATTTLILVGLAVAFAFRCGLFNIGGQGQYLSGAILAVWIGSSFEGLSPVLHVLLALVIGTAAGAAIGGHRRASSRRPSAPTR